MKETTKTVFAASTLKAFERAADAAATLIKVGAEIGIPSDELYYWGS